MLHDNETRFSSCIQLREFEDFFSINGRSSLIFFYRSPTAEEEAHTATTSSGRATPSYNANGRLLWITDGTTDEYTGRCLFFLRFNASKAITMLNIHQVCMLLASDQDLGGKGNLVSLFEPLV